MGIVEELKDTTKTVVDVRKRGEFKDCLVEKISRGAKNRNIDIFLVGRKYVGPRVRLFLHCKTHEKAKKLLRGDIEM